MTASLATPLNKLIPHLRRDNRALFEYLAHLEGRFQTVESQVQAFVPEADRFGRLRAEAELLIKRYADHDHRPPLFGVPVGVKDIYHVQGFVTRAGSRLDSDLLQGAESTAISLIKQAGALILGKTVTTEFAYFAPGPTRNPHNLAHTPGGSSSGSAAAVAAGLCSLTFGTQTIGSVNRPAAFCGVAGYKPSFDRVSKAGILPLSVSADHVGFFTPQAADLASVAWLLADTWQPTQPDRPPVLGVPQGPYLDHASTEGLAQFEDDCRRLGEAGYVIKRVPLMDDFANIAARHQLLVAAEASQVHETWYAAYSILYHPKTAELIERGQQVTAEELAQARRGQIALRETITAVMQEQGVDLWLSPSAVGPAPLGLESTGDPVMNLPWTHAGLPTVTIHTGISAAGLPLGLQLAAGWYEDEVLLAWSPQIEETLAGY